ncbi:hypothetical protein [Rhizobium sp. 21-4511-3d]
MNTALQNAKGPAEAATSPDRGSAPHPTKEKAMNKTETISNSSTKKATDAAVAAAMKRLENDIRELMHMSDIAAETFDEIGSVVDSGSNDVTYRFTNHEMDQMAFLVNNVASRCTSLHRAFEAAYQGEVMS